MGSSGRGGEIASPYVAQINVGRYSEFLADPQETDLYWSLRNELDQLRESIGARFVYFVRIDDRRQTLNRTWSRFCI